MVHGAVSGNWLSITITARSDTQAMRQYKLRHSQHPPQGHHRLSRSGAATSNGCYLRLTLTANSFFCKGRVDRQGHAMSEPAAPCDEFSVNGQSLPAYRSVATSPNSLCETICSIVPPVITSRQDRWIDRQSAQCVWIDGGTAIDEGHDQAQQRRAQSKWCVAPRIAPSNREYSREIWIR